MSKFKVFLLSCCMVNSCCAGFLSINSHAVHISCSVEIGDSPTLIEQLKQRVSKIGNDMHCAGRYIRVIAHDLRKYVYSCPGDAIIIGCLVISVAAVSYYVWYKISHKYKHISRL